jgi:hypothetical protein
MDRDFGLCNVPKAFWTQLYIQLWKDPMENLGPNLEPQSVPAPSRSADPLLGIGDWWVEITTETPACCYYFGPFAHAQDAQQMVAGYTEDLTQEGADGMGVVVKRCYPSQLTVGI